MGWWADRRARKDREAAERRSTRNQALWDAMGVDPREHQRLYDADQQRMNAERAARLEAADRARAEERLRAGAERVREAADAHRDAADKNRRMAAYDAAEFAVRDDSQVAAPGSTTPADREAAAMTEPRSWVEIHPDASDATFQLGMAKTAAELAARIDACVDIANEADVDEALRHEEKRLTDSPKGRDMTSKLRAALPMLRQEMLEQVPIAKKAGARLKPTTLSALNLGEVAEFAARFDMYNGAFGQIAKVE